MFAMKDFLVDLVIKYKDLVDAWKIRKDKYESEDLVMVLN